MKAQKFDVTLIVTLYDVKGKDPEQAKIRAMSKTADKLGDDCLIEPMRYRPAGPGAAKKRRARDAAQSE